MPPGPRLCQPACQAVVLGQEGQPVRPGGKLDLGEHRLRVPADNRRKCGRLGQERAGSIPGVIVNAQPQLPVRSGDVVAQALDCPALR